MTTLKELSQLSGSMDCGDFYFRDLDTGKTRTYLNYANKIDIKETANSQFAKAKGKNSIEFQEPTEFEISMDVQMWNPSLLGLIHGGEPVQGAENFAKREKHKVATANGDVVLSGVPYANKIDVYVLGEDEVTHLKELEVSYDADSKTVTCTGAEEGDLVAVYYLEESECLTNTIKAVPDEKQFFELEGTIRQKTKAKGKTTLLNLLAKKVSISGTVSFSFDTANPNGFTITMNVLEDNDGNLAKIRTLSQTSGTSSIEVIPISDLEVISQGADSAVITFSKPIGATSVTLKYTDDDGSTWKDVKTSGSSGIRIAGALNSDSKNATITGLTSGTYKFKLVVVGGAYSGESNETAGVVIS